MRFFKKRKLILAGMIVVLLAAFLWSPFSNYPISLAVMKIYSGIHEKDSIMEQKGIRFTVPGGGLTEEKDWYPFVMTFHAGESFGRFIGQENLSLTILYNFPAFDWKKGCSRLYDPASPYYNSFYGAYLVDGKTKEGLPYGFGPDGELDPKTTAQVPQFDFQRLVLADLGISQSRMVFDWKISDIKKDVFYAESEGWTRVDAELTVNGVFHKKEDYRRSYLQYGPPSSTFADGNIAPFEPVEMKGRLYGKYFAQWDVSAFFYILASEEDVLLTCDEEILSRSVLEEKLS